MAGTSISLARLSDGAIACSGCCPVGQSGRRLPFRLAGFSRARQQHGRRHSVSAWQSPSPGHAGPSHAQIQMRYRVALAAAYKPTEPGGRTTGSDPDARNTRPRAEGEQCRGHGWGQEGEELDQSWLARHAGPKRVQSAARLIEDHPVCRRSRRSLILD